MGGDLSRNLEKDARDVVMSWSIQLSQSKLPVLLTQKKTLMPGCLFRARLLTEVSNYLTISEKRTVTIVNKFFC